MVLWTGSKGSSRLGMWLAALPGSHLQHSWGRGLRFVGRVQFRSQPAFSEPLDFRALICAVSWSELSLNYWFSMSVRVLPSSATYPQAWAWCWRPPDCHTHQRLMEFRSRNKTPAMSHFFFWEYGAWLPWNWRQELDLKKKMLIILNQERREHHLQWAELEMNITWNNYTLHPQLVQGPTN